VGQLVFEFTDEFRVFLVVRVGLAQLVDGVRERLRDEAAAVGAKVSAGIGLRVIHGFWLNGLRRGKVTLKTQKWKTKNAKADQLIAEFIASDFCVFCVVLALSALHL
jgi:hypothetical protein